MSLVLILIVLNNFFLVFESLVSLPPSCLCIVCTYLVGISLFYIIKVHLFWQQSMQQQQDKNDISVTWRAKKFIVPVTPNATLREFGDSLQKLTDVRADTLRLIVRSDKSSKMLYPFSDEHSSLTLQETPLFQVPWILVHLLL